MFVKARQADRVAAGSGHQPRMSQSVTQAPRRTGAHLFLKIAVCAAVPFAAFAQTPSASSPAGASGPELRNWFNDPFLQISQDAPGCPTPLGPFLTRAQMLGQSHDRIERGNSCYHAGQCRHASAYEYDPEIAAAAQQRLHDDPRLRDSALWITVQRRFITLQGCAASARQIDYVADALRHLPDVQHVTVDVSIRRPQVHR
ncbi:MAG: BON domain-containing protein [Ralstonia sp.]|jgi:hypothetical protein|nr:MAG: BON domain-containing protein [Ralstonia sp.]